jgi:peptide/nickel transport system substrate-binding protein
MFDSKLSGGALDYAGFHTPELDAQFARVSAARTQSDLTHAWHEIQRLLERETPVAWVYHARGVQGVTAKLTGVRMDLRGEMPTLAQWRLAEPRAGQ